MPPLKHYLIPTVRRKRNVLKSSTLKLKRKFYIALLALLIAFGTMVTATFAWYIYNTSAHTTKLRMAAGSSVALQISTSYNGNYSSTALLESFTGRLVPVSADKIVDSSDRPLFQKVSQFTDGKGSQPARVASVFNNAVETDFYRTSLYLRSNGGSCDLYLADIGYKDSSSTQPISTAIRVGFVVHTPGSSGSVQEQLIFAINPEGANPNAQYNTATGEEGFVLNSARKDGSTVRFSPYTSNNYANYNESTGQVSLKSNSVKFCELEEDASPVKVDVYIWLEGCDKDCTDSLGSMTLKDVSLSFVGY